MRAGLSRHRRRLATAAALLCFAAAVGAVAHQDSVNGDISVKLTVSAQATIAGCQRLNLQIIQANRASAALYSLLSLTVSDLGQRATAPGIGPYLTRLRSARDAQRWIMPTECAASVAAHGAHYKLASPVPFTVSQPPPVALTIPAGA